MLGLKLIHVSKKGAPGDTMELMHQAISIHSAD